MKLADGPLLRYRCHIGHAFSAESLASSIGETAVESLGKSLRALEENALLFEQLARHFEHHGRSKMAATVSERAGVARQNARALHQVLLQFEQLSDKTQLPEIEEEEDIPKKKRAGRSR